MSRDEQCQMNIRIDRELYDRLKAISEREERTLAQTIRYALRRYVADEVPAPQPVYPAQPDPTPAMWPAHRAPLFDNESGIS